jgi:YHS domain-containing protein
VNGARITKSSRTVGGDVISVSVARRAILAPSNARRTEETMATTWMAGALGLVALVVASTAQAGNQLAVAIGGYDPVSYFGEGPTRGEARFNHFWNGAVWYFASADNRDTFAADPAAYAPAYDGYCSYAASQGYKAPGDPLVYAVEENRLFLQVHPRALELWEADVAGHVAQGDANWPRIHPF